MQQNDFDLLSSWLDVPDNSDFSIYNVPFGIFSTKTLTSRVGTAIGNSVVDISVLAAHGYLDGISFNHGVLIKSYLNDFISEGKDITNSIRLRIQNLLSKDNTELQKRREIHLQVFYPMENVTMQMPVKVGDYTDFYSSKEHATNVGSMFRDPVNALLPNWKHLPVGYHGRASSIVVSGTPVKTPHGQIKDINDEVPKFSLTQELDFELEMGFIVGKNSTLGIPIPIDRAEDYIFGFVLFNDWSARDIQRWEYVPLGPFLSKNFMSSMSPWVVTLEALGPFRTSGPEQDVRVLPYLACEGNKNFDVDLKVYIQPEGSTPRLISHSNFKYMYWNICQQLAHHTVNGCNVNVGDLMASGTISGPGKDSYGSMLELTWRGTQPISMPDGSTRKFLERGDTVTIKGFARNGEVHLGFGDVSGKII
jgi:fumarylacetoacetase